MYLCNIVNNYKKVKEGNIESHPSQPDDIIINNGSKIRNVVEQCLTSLKNDHNETIRLQGNGKNITKTISCAEILKRKWQVLYQRNEIYYDLSEDIWEPQKEGLESLKVKRHIPAITITLSKKALDAELPGYQGPSNQLDSKPDMRHDYYSRGSSRRGRGHSRRSMASDSTNNRRRNRKGGGKDHTDGNERRSQQLDTVKSSPAK